MKRRAGIALVALCAMLRPASAFAQSDIIDWLEQLSGPGPFHGYFQSANVRVLCTRDGDRRASSCIADTDDTIKTILSAEFAWTSSDSYPRFADAINPQNTLPVHASRILANYYYRVSPMLDIGVGVGAMVFTGDGFDNQVHPILTPLTVSFVPLGFLRDGPWLKWGRVFRVKYSERYIVGDIRAATDFNATGSTYLKHGEINRGLSLGVDFWPFFRR